jgi:alanine racemase
MLQITIAEIDLNAIKHNITLIKKKLPNKKVLFAVKANGYGHGAVAVSKAVEDEQIIDMLGVATPAEGIELRLAGIQLPILILGLILPEEEVIASLIEYNLSQTVADAAVIDAIARIAQQMNAAIPLHLKIDTGMGRIGCEPAEAVELAEHITSQTSLVLEGVFTHLPVSDIPESDFTRQQIDQFKRIIRSIEESGIPVPSIHIANSAAILNDDEPAGNMVRAGIMAYGYLPSPTCRRSMPIIPAMTLKSRIVFLKRVRKGTPLSYGHTYTTERDTTIATIPVGYGDGYNRLLSNKGKVLISGKEYPVVGRVCMDQMLVNLGDDHHHLGEEVILFGKETITAETIAEWTETIPYEITCSISRRIPRVYHL